MKFFASIICATMLFSNSLVVADGCNDVAVAKDYSSLSEYVNKKETHLIGSTLFMPVVKSGPVVEVGVSSDQGASWNFYTTSLSDPEASYNLGSNGVSFTSNQTGLFMYLPVTHACEYPEYEGGTCSRDIWVYKYNESTHNWNIYFEITPSDLNGIDDPNTSQDERLFSVSPGFAAMIDGRLKFSDDGTLVLLFGFNTRERLAGGNHWRGSGVGIGRYDANTGIWSTTVVQEYSEHIDYAQGGSDTRGTWPLPLTVTNYDGKILSTDQHGNWICLLDGDNATHDNCKILLSSTDDGATWSSPNFRMSAYREITSADTISIGSGKFVVGWSELLSGNTDGDLVYSIVNLNSGLQWSASQPLNIDAGEDVKYDGPVRFAMRTATQLSAVWGTEYNQILSAEFNEFINMWTDPAIVAEANCAGFDPDISSVGNNQVLASWINMSSNKILTKKYSSASVLTLPTNYTELQFDPLQSNFVSTNLEDAGFGSVQNGSYSCAYEDGPLYQKWFKFTSFSSYYHCFEFSLPSSWGSNYYSIQAFVEEDNQLDSLGSCYRPTHGCEWGFDQLIDVWFNEGGGARTYYFLVTVSTYEQDLSNVPLIYGIGGN